MRQGYFSSGNGYRGRAQEESSTSNSASTDRIRGGKCRGIRGLAGCVGVSDALGHGAGTLAGDIDEAGVAGDLVEGGEGALRLGEEIAVKVGFELEEGVVDAQAVVFHAALQQHDQFLLASKTLKNLEKLGGRSVQRVVEAGFVGFRALLPAEGLFAEVGDFAVDVEILVLEMVHLRGEFEHLGAQGCADFER